jgi:hypothetical protein
MTEPAASNVTEDDCPWCGVRLDDHELWHVGPPAGETSTVPLPEVRQCPQAPASWTAMSSRRGGVVYVQSPSPVPPKNGGAVRDQST